MNVIARNDLRLGSLGACVNPRIETPDLERLASERVASSTIPTRRPAAIRMVA